MRGFMASVGLNFAVGAALCLAVGSMANPALCQDFCWDIQSTILRFGPATRAKGMGETGAADAADPSNAFYNPAVISATSGVFLSGAYGTLWPGLSPGIYIFHVSTGAGVSFVAGNSTELKLGGGIGFSRLDFGEFEPSPGNLTVLCRPGPESETAIGFTMGGEAVFEKTLHAAMGFALKPVWLQLKANDWIQQPAAKGNGIAYDLGFLLAVDILKGPDLRLSTSVGFSMLNLGSEIELSNVTRSDPAQLPKEYRIGLGLRLEGPRAVFLGRESPVAALSANCDMSDRDGSEMVHANSDYWGAGMEAAVLDMLFIRFGCFNERYYYERFDAADYTFGIGIGLTAKAYRVRLDYATVLQPAGIENAHKLGLTCGVNI